MWKDSEKISPPSNIPLGPVRKGVYGGHSTRTLDVRMEGLRDGEKHYVFQLRASTSIKTIS